MKWYDYIRAPIQWLILFPLQLALILLGFIVVPVALLFRKTDVSTSRPFTQYPVETQWMLVTLPRWAWLWSNDLDGAMGDRRGWWNQNAPFKGGASSYWNMLCWLAFRNPAHNSMDVPRTGLSLSYVGMAYVRDRVGGSGWQFVKVSKGWRRWYGLYIVREYANIPGRAFVVRIGFKVDPHDLYADGSLDTQIGMTYRILPYKKL